MGGALCGAAFSQHMARGFKLMVEADRGLPRLHLGRREAAAFLRVANGLHCRAALHIAQLHRHGLRLAQHGAQGGEAECDLGGRQGCRQQNRRRLGGEAHEQRQQRRDLRRQPRLFGTRGRLGLARGLCTPGGAQGGAFGGLHTGRTGDARFGQALRLCGGLARTVGGQGGGGSFALGGGARAGRILRPGRGGQQKQQGKRANHTVS